MASKVPASIEATYQLFLPALRIFIFFVVQRRNRWHSRAKRGSKIGFLCRRTECTSIRPFCRAFTQAQ